MHRRFTVDSLLDALRTHSCRSSTSLQPSRPVAEGKGGESETMGIYSITEHCACDMSWFGGIKPIMQQNVTSESAARSWRRVPPSWVEWGLFRSNQSHGHTPRGSAWKRFIPNRRVLEEQRGQSFPESYISHEPGVSGRAAISTLRTRWARTNRASPVKYVSSLEEHLPLWENAFVVTGLRPSSAHASVPNFDIGACQDANSFSRLSMEEWGHAVVRPIQNDASGHRYRPRRRRV